MEVQEPERLQRENPRLVLIRPGVAESKPLIGVIPDEIDKIDEALNYVLENAEQREAKHRASSIKAEMNGGEYAISARKPNSQEYVVVENGEPVAHFIAEEVSEAGNQYQALNLLVAQSQEGGADDTRYLLC